MVNTLRFHLIGWRRGQETALPSPWGAKVGPWA
jgi:hypothetical protein